MWQLLRVSAIFGVLSACTQPAPQVSMTLLGGDLTVTAPQGYCLDMAASAARRGFAVMAPCATLEADKPMPRVIGLATVQVGDTDSGEILGDGEELRDFLLTDAGAAILSEAGRADMVEVIGSQVKENAVKVHFVDSSPPAFDGAQSDEWRAFLAIGGRLVTVAVRGLEASPLNDGTGGWLLDNVVAGLGQAPVIVPPQQETTVRADQAQ